MARNRRAKVDADSDNQLADAVRDSAQQIWLAGLGAFAKAQQEGNKVFEALVREGSVLQRRTLLVTEDRLGEITGRVTKAAGEFSRHATESWDKLEQVFENRVARALARLGVPAARDIQELTHLLNELNDKVAALGDVKAASPRKAVRSRKAGATKPTKAPGPKPAN